MSNTFDIWVFIELIFLPVTGTVYVCNICNTECSHYNTMRRHLKRRHSDNPLWQADPPNYIAGLKYEPGDLMMTAKRKIIAEKCANIPGIDMDSLLRNDPDNPLIVAEV